MYKRQTLANAVINPIMRTFYSQEDPAEKYEYIRDNVLSSSEQVEVGTFEQAFAQMCIRDRNKAMVLMMDKIDLLAELDEAVYMYRERAISENKHLDFEEPESISPVLADKNRMRQVFVNVIDNALKYTPEDGMVSIRVQEDEKFIHIYIVDNGCGIPAEHLPRVKDKFYKANQTQRASGLSLINI